MIRTLTIAAFAAALSYTAANAMDFPAAPMNAGPPTSSLPIVGQTLMVVNGVTQPIVQPLLVSPAPAPMAEPAPPMVHHRHHHHYHHGA